MSSLKAQADRNLMGQRLLEKKGKTLEAKALYGGRIVPVT